MSISEAEEQIFKRRRLSLYVYGLFAANVAAFALRSFAGKWLIDKDGNLAFIDFLQWWVGGHFALMRNAAGAYDYHAFSAAQALATKAIPPVEYFHWVYPPTMLLLVAPISRLPYTIAFLVWVVATLCLYLVGIYETLPYLLSILMALLPLPVVKNIFDGQTAFMMAGLLSLSMVLIERRPYLSGIFLGILTYKPQFVLFFPFVLIVTGQWRVIAGAIASALLLALAATLAFGSDVWLLFLRSMQSHNSATLLPPNLDALNQTVFGLMHQAGAGVTAAWVMHSTVAVAITVLACQVWFWPVSNSLKAATFSIGALIATPYMLAYDLTALTVPAAFLVNDALARGFLPGERLVLTACFLALFLCFTFVIGPIVLLALLALAVRRVVSVIDPGVSSSEVLDKEEARS